MGGGGVGREGNLPRDSFPAQGEGRNSDSKESRANGEKKRILYRESRVMLLR